MCVFTAVHAPKETLRAAAAAPAPLGGGRCAPRASELVRPQLLPVLVLSPWGHLTRRARVFQGPGLSHEAFLRSQVTGSSLPCHAGPTGLSPLPGVLSQQLSKTRWDTGPPCAAWSHLRGPVRGVLAPQPEAKEVSQLAQGRGAHRRSGV